MELIQNDSLWFGEYGGCFVADAFSMYCDNYYKQFVSAIESQDFTEKFNELKSKYQQEFKLLDDHTVLIPENYYAAIGTALLYKCLSKKQALIGCRYAQDALFAAKLCNDLDINAKMYVTKELAHNRSLINYLELSGIEVNTKNCEELINHPEMYCFQEWLAESKDKHIINFRANVGAFPQVNIASYFVRKYRDDFIKFADDNGLKADKIAIPVISGTDALGIIDPEDQREYVTVECDEFDDLYEELDSFCGTFTRVERNNYVDRVLCPELCKLWDDKKVQRVMKHKKDIDKDIVKKYPNLSLQSYALLCEFKQDYLRVVKSRKEGMDL